MVATNATWVRHPGFYIKEEMEERGWLQRDLAFILGIPEQAINMILGGKRGISPEMANALGSAFDVEPEFFANLQQRFDLANAKSADPIVAVRGSMQSSYPIREMVKRGWLDPSDTALLETQLVRFFNVPSMESISYLPHAAKKSRYEEREVPPAQLAWLFRVKQIAHSISVPKYSESALRDTVKEFESLLTAPEEARLVPKMLAECGVRFIVVEKLSNAGIDGVCFWVDGSPVIGMSLQRDQIDNFWFVLRHECEHVLNGDGKDEEVIDESLVGKNAATDTSVPEQERQANLAAADFCMPVATMDDFMLRKKPYYYEKDVLSFARLHHRHPGLIVGQMQVRLDNYGYLHKHLAKIRQAVTPAAIADGWGQLMALSL